MLIVRLPPPPPPSAITQSLLPVLDAAGVALIRVQPCMVGIGDQCQASVNTVLGVPAVEPWHPLIRTIYIYIYIALTIGHRMNQYSLCN